MRLPMHVLILGGTAEARQLAGQLAGRAEFSAILSLAGRTAAPAAQPVPVRLGGFGGAVGLADYLVAERIDVLIDATHPYAAKISANAAQAAMLAACPLLVLRRPPWTPVAGDRWTPAEDVAAAVRILGKASRSIFLALGRKEIAPFAAAPQHRYLVRSVDPVVPPLAVPHAIYITARGPFAQADEHDLLVHHGIEAIVAKNSGGEASYGKIAAARALGIEVVILRRPPADDGGGMPSGASVATVAEAVAKLVSWLGHVPASGAAT